MERVHTFKASDGKTFETAAECKRYEKLESLVISLADLSREQVSSALDRSDIDLAAVFERAGNIIAAKRRASGDFTPRPRKLPSPFSHLKPDTFEGVEEAMRKVAK